MADRNFEFIVCLFRLELFISFIDFFYAEAKDTLDNMLTSVLLLKRLYSIMKFWLLFLEWKTNA